MTEWDGAKNLQNIAKHGVSFELAQRIFDGPVLTWIDERRDYGEQREVSIGMVDGVLVLTVAHTDRSGVRRLISARPASRRERSRYEQALR
ncbi:MAG: BrnT family toxin [Elsteraceae bacterium]